MKTIEQNNPTNQQTKRSLAQKYFLWLDPCEIWCLMRKKTRFNSTFYDCIRLALENPSDTICGLYAYDGDCYEVFRNIFWPVIMDYHKVDIRNLTFKHDFGDVQHIHDLSSDINRQILSIRIRINRSIQGYPMIPKLNLNQLLEIEERIRNALEYLDQDLHGEYRSLKDISDVDQIDLREKSILFQKPAYHPAINAIADDQWPTGRGIFINKNQNFIIWINEEDNLSFISQSNDGKMNEIYERMIRAIEKLNQTFEFQQHQRLGYLNLSPMNIGTALQVNIHIKLLHLEKSNPLIEFCKKLDIHIENTNEYNIFNLSNIIRLGRTEFNIIRLMWNGIEQIIKQDIHQS
ncbi:unnamed protein product [Rotaria magnacalcarata]|uniref:Arginine kinase n=3 Tax=Rotaria magnacalcarata TaxID=392030 RepID=A0A819JMD9_9BILA|nr:unnamed protein product [Rotaria magnacalcarata]CAF2045263.1 unnamed protein product [Rotaria magnacalcarata]CAF2116292.1 unnamed protein product [Rotaria magnacalcarata]CAF3936228.1 unnamed protein product [Rotaria magnacalcarata]CAF3996203.1 unnamed protein product [Rotaria magnacalcarata]